MALFKQEGFEQGKQRIGGAAAVVSKVMGSLRIECWVGK